jgi:Flp pilus assembly pilin Flp
MGYMAPTIAQIIEKAPIATQDSGTDAQKTTLSEKTLKAIKSVKEMRMQGKDYIICKYYLLSEGFSDHEANQIWHLSKQMVTTSEKAMIAGMKSFYRLVFFIGGIMAVFMYVGAVKVFNILIATVFALIFLRYSRFAHLLKITGIAEESVKRSNPFREKDPLEMRWFDYGVISGFIAFLLLAYAYPSTFGAFLDALISEYTNFEGWIEGGQKIGASIFS